MKIKFIASAVIVVLSTTAQATPLKPDSCPSVESISANRIENYLKEDGQGQWAIELNDTFGTKEHWNVTMTLYGSNYEDAAWKARIYINQIALLRDGPFPYGNTWYCTYEGYKHYHMTARIL